MPVKPKILYPAANFQNTLDPSATSGTLQAYSNRNFFECKYQHSKFFNN